MELVNSVTNFQKLKTFLISLPKERSKQMQILSQQECEIKRNDCLQGFEKFFDTMKD